MRKFLVLFLVFVMCLVTGCSNGNGSASKLNDYEDLFVSAFKQKLSNFKDPNSVSIISINGSGCNGAVVKFTVSAKNSFGGTITDTYVLSTVHFSINDSSCGAGYLEDYNTVMSEGKKLIPSKGYYVTLYMGLTDGKDSNSSYNVGKINEALNNYKKTMGWM